MSTSTNLRDQVNRGRQIYQETLEHYGIRRRCGAFEEVAIGRAVQRWGPEIVLLALEGARYEPVGEKFQPSRWLSLNRVLEESNVERFANLAAGRNSGGPETYPVEIPPPPGGEAIQFAEDGMNGELNLG